MKISHVVPRRRPARTAPSLFDDFDRLFDAFWPATHSPAGATAAFAPSLDVHETTDALVVTVDLPGVRAQDLEVVSEQDVLTIRGERCPGGEADPRPDRRWSERAWGRFERRLRFPDPARLEDATARYRDGVLTITVPKTPDASTAARRLTIDVA